MLTIRAIASGSNGNAILAETPQAAVLLDAGMAASRILEHLDGIGVDRRRIDAVVLTHEHSDHAAGAAVLARKLGVPIYGTEGTLRAMRLAKCAVEMVGVERTFRIKDLAITPFRLSHDAADPVGLLAEHHGHRMALATDLGSADERVVEWLCHADLVVLEANHDVGKLWGGPYPYRLKRRIASPTGHLSNDQAAACFAAAAERGRMRFAWLAHLSETNNTHRAALAAVQARLAGALVSVEVARRSRPSLVWRSGEAYLQGRLF